jgi:uncharacterized protein (TIGR02271 family)
MSRTITALFDSRSDAEAAKARLRDANVDISGLSIADQSTQGYNATGYSSHEDKGIWASIKGAFLPDEDRHHYEEGVRRGGYLLSGEVDDDEAEEAVRVLDTASSVDIDGRANDWRASGWDYAAPAAAGVTSGTATGLTGERSYGETGNEQSIPIVEESLRVGKREVDRGGVRVRSYVVETPVSEQVNLREENVSVERRRVDQPLSAADGDAFRERTIEMTETAEEAVVAKDARVVEEVIVRKDVDNRTETVSDTVRRTEVEVDDTAGTASGASYGSTGLATGASASAASLGDKVAGLAKEGAGKVTGNEDLERRGEAQQGKTSTGY